VKPKIVSRQALIGQRGVNVIERIVLDMGSRWVPSPVLDVGIDGVIELCDPTSRAALGIVLHVQSRATEDQFTAETAGSFEYLCSERDLDYWLQGNAPVILVVSRPPSNEAYWVPIKDYFADTKRRSTRRVVFDKTRDRFSPQAFHELLQTGASRDAGIFLAPPRTSERILTNLLTVRSFGERVFVADTDYRTRGELWDALKREGYQGGGEWFTKERRLVSFLDLREPPWPKVCDRGTVDDFSAEEWSQADDPDRVRDFVRLLNSALREKLYPLVRFWPDEGVFAFTAGPGLRERRIRRAGARSGGRVVFSEYVSKRSSRRVAYRHLAFDAQFRRYGGRWYLEIVPTYLFTTDGRQVAGRNGEYVAAMKRLDRHEAVRGNLATCTEVLTRAPGLFGGDYRFLSFGGLVELDLDVGINDKAWLAGPEVEAASETEPEEADGLWG
jgi:hypothetical protein